MVMVGDVWRMFGKDWKVVDCLKDSNGPTMFELMETGGRGGLLGGHVHSSAAYISTYGVLVKRPGVTQAVVPPEVAERRKRRKAKLSDGHRAMFCEHANEVPVSCRCEPDCYCKEHTCKQQRDSRGCTHAGSPTGPPGGVCKCEKGGCYCWRQPGGCGETDPVRRYAEERAIAVDVKRIVSGVLENATVTQIPHTAAALIVEALTSAGYEITTRPTSRPATSPSTPPRPPRPRRSRPRRPS